MWYGKKAKSTLKSKARLMAEKINKNERKNKAEIITEVMNTETEDFFLHLDVEGHERKNLQIIVNFYNVNKFIKFSKTLFIV
jgi:N-acetylneuraminic acid mutarotase